MNVAPGQEVVLQAGKIIEEQLAVFVLFDVPRLCPGEVGQSPGLSVITGDLGSAGQRLVGETAIKAADRMPFA